MRMQQLLIGCLALSTLLLQLCPTWAARILAVFPYDMHSQCMLLTPYLHALLQRGHHLTLIHAFTDCEIVKQLHSIHIKDRYDTVFEFNAEEVMSMSKWVEVNSTRNYFVKICINVLQNEEVQQLMRSNVSYDLMILEPSYTDALFGLAAHFNANLIGLATCGADWNMDTLVGNVASLTLEPLLPHGFMSGVTLLERFYNWILISEEWMMHKLIYLPSLQAVHEHFFGHLKQSFMEIRQSFSVILLNQHFSLFPARPNVPGLVEVGGMHVPKMLAPLSPELAQFIEEAPHGVIVMNLGMELQSKDLPAVTLRLIVDTFETLPQRIIWKFEGNARPNVSSRIYLAQWLPLQAILAHPNVRLLISHGGILSIIEAAHYGKPVLGLPLFFDQFRNVECMQAEGVAELLDINSMTRQEFEATLRQLLEQPQYHHNALQLSERIQDQPLHPLDTAVYWTEYVLRHKGARHMRISTSNMKFMDYYCMDNLLIIVGRLGVLVGLVAYVLYKSLWFLKSRSCSE
ncbi:UDP-glycosyltransferase UGT5 [Drosophila virilis]|uniref:UDP-glucuronosyltransferase n=1 Tax=Drosophila virilis TaxID=7244 RepID=B4LYF0_DROVI|nr:2-hydroxyacylsphingosine 1-beta-galactosyltransferase [Drosophila virilis]EDW66946.2 uncharacterized protein Dvir_GJ23872 [Drosophila virilis]